jgi:hypothetical protein
MQQQNSHEDCTRRRHRGAVHDVGVDICSGSARLNDQFTMAQRSLLTGKTNQFILFLLLLLSLARITTSSDNIVQHDAAAPACASNKAHCWLSDSSTQSFMAAAEQLGIRCVCCCLHPPRGSAEATGGLLCGNDLALVCAHAAWKVLRLRRSEGCAASSHSAICRLALSS